MTEHADNVAFMSKSYEWYTPSVYIEAAREVLGTIELDPASSELANQHVKAKHYFTYHDDALYKEWFGNVWLNPPYGKFEFMGNKVASRAAVWSRKLIWQYAIGNVQSAVMLLNSKTAEQWFKPFWAQPMCFTDHRIRFFNPNQPKKHQPAHGSVFIYFGQQADKFRAVFKQFGTVTTPHKNFIQWAA